MNGLLYRLDGVQELGRSSIDVFRGPSGALVGEFGPSPYGTNVARMQECYSKSGDGSKITFRPATSGESLGIIAANISRLKENLLDFGSRLQISRVARASEGVYVNVRGDESEVQLKDYLGDAQKVRGIWLPRKSVGTVAFVPYETFDMGEQEAERFVRGGLARGLELTGERKARSFATITSSNEYLGGVNVRDFGPVEEVSMHGIANLVSFDGVILGLRGSNIFDSDTAFGVFTGKLK